MTTTNCCEHECSCEDIGCASYTAAATGLVLYYDSATDKCYSGPTSGVWVPIVRVNTDATTVVITFSPRPGSSALPLHLVGVCGTDSDCDTAPTTTISGVHTVYFTSPSTAGQEWGWNFNFNGITQAIKIKVRVRRI